MDVEQHYQQSLDPDALLAQVDKLLGSGLSPEQLAPIDQLHLGGRRASRALFERVPLRATMRVLDVGCGLGGTSRLIAELGGCSVVGIDLTGHFCQLATALSERLAQPLPASFVQGDAQRLPFAEASFDLIVSQHCLMNLPDPATALRGFRRLLKPGGKVLLHELLSGPGGEPYYPVPWASEAGQSFLADEATLRRWVDGAGFAIDDWQDESETSLAWRTRHGRREQRGVPALSAALVYGQRFTQLAGNLQRSLAEQRVRVVRAELG